MGGKKKTINRLINSAKYAVSEFTSQDQIEIHSNNLAFINGCLICRNITKIRSRWKCIK